MIVIFDLDGTLADTMKLHINAFLHVLEKNGYELDKKKTKKDIDKFRGMTGMQILRALTGKKNVDKLYGEKKEFVAKRMHMVKEMRGATKVLDKLKENGHKIALVTSSKKYFAKQVMEKFGWEFDMVVTADDVKNPKPDVEPYKKVIDKFGKPCIIVGDGINDEIPAKGLGLKFLRFGKDIKKLEQLFDYLS